MAGSRRLNRQLKTIANMTLMRANIEELVGFVSLCYDLGAAAAPDLKTLAPGSGWKYTLVEDELQS